jgi:hypothetical protein
MHRSKTRVNGFTIIDLAATAAAGVVLASTAVPVLSNASASGGREQSRANMQQLGDIHTMYAFDHEDRQFSLLPDDFTGNATLYQLQHGCIEPLVLGTDMDGAQWGYYLSCGGQGGNNGNIVMYTPMGFTNPLDGLYRMANTPGINAYANGRFYDPLFFAPDDPALREGDLKLMRSGADFGFSGPPFGYARTSYAMSPAAMWSPRVMGDGQRMKNAQFRPPSGAQQDYRSPRVSECLHPSLKTRMMEHHATNNAPAPCNPAFAGCVPYLWNQSIETRNLALFYDGSVAEFGIEETLVAEDAVGADFWLRNTPLGQLGVYGEFAQGGLTSSAHFLTTFGIRGRDRLAPVD